MKLNAQLRDTNHEMGIDLAGDAVNATIEGRSYEIRFRELDGGEILLFRGADVFRCRVDAKRDSRNSFEVSLRGRSYDVNIVDPKRMRSGELAGAHHHGSAEIVSPMPGKVVRVLVEAGKQVEAGDGIVVVEAMKMQNEMKSPKAGVVVSINAEVGATVNAGDVLAVIE